MTKSRQITLAEALPCGMVVDDDLCHQPATIAFVTRDITDTVPDERGYFRLLPVCEQHHAALSEPPTLISEFDQSFVGRPNWEWE